MGKEIERKFVVKVSNPWREAIEGCKIADVLEVKRGFQSLEGGY